MIAAELEKIPDGPRKGELLEGLRRIQETEAGIVF